MFAFNLTSSYKVWYPSFLIMKFYVISLLTTVLITALSSKSVEQSHHIQQQSHGVIIKPVDLSSSFFQTAAFLAIFIISSFWIDKSTVFLYVSSLFMFGVKRLQELGHSQKNSHFFTSKSPKN